MSGVCVREGRREDWPALAALLHDTVRGAPAVAAAYTEAERAAWSPAPPEPGAWAERLAHQRIWVAEDGGALAGFVSLTCGGVVDFAYVRADLGGQGIGRALMEALEAAARAAGHARLTAAASLAAEPFFAARGFSVVRRNEIDRGGIALRNATMEKRL